MHLFKNIRKLRIFFSKTDNFARDCNVVHIKFFQVQARCEHALEHAAITSVRISRRISVGFTLDLPSKTQENMSESSAVSLDTMDDNNSKEVTNCETNSGNDAFEYHEYQECFCSNDQQGRDYIVIMVGKARVKFR